MGGEVLELMDDKIERSRKEGIQEGVEQAESILAEQMAALGIDQAVIDRMMADAAAKISSQQRPDD